MTMRMRLVGGFTLIELLVVISIIGILVTIGTSSYVAAQKRARDAKRRSDVRALQIGFEQYFANESNYNLAGGENSCEHMFSYNGGELFGGRALQDPQGGGYDLGCSDAGYCACAQLEVGQGNSDGRVGVSCSFDSSGDEVYFCLENQQ